MAVVPISSQINVEEYWQIKALSIEWLYVLQKLAESVKVAQQEMHCVVGTSFDNQPLYMLKRSFYPTEVISKATGIERDKLEGYAGVITLKATPQDGVPEATVGYWGTA